MRIYGSYSFVDKDPICYEVRDAIEREALPVKDVAALSGVGASTIYNIMFGQTKRPQNATIEAIMRSLGYKRTWTRDGKKVRLSTQEAAHV